MNRISPLGVKRDAIGLDQTCVDSAAAVAGVDFRAVADGRRDHPGGRIDPARPEIEPIRAEHVPSGIDDDSIRLIELGFDGRAAVAGKPLGAVAGERCDCTGGMVDLADTVVEGVGNVRVSTSIKGDIERLIQPGLSGRRRRYRRADPSRPQS